MELVYLPDTMTRYSAFNVYPTWDELNYKDKYSRTQKSCSYKENKISEKNCSICQQKKKRILSDYIKNKQMDCRKSTSIREEDEEAEDANNRQADGKSQKI